MEKFNSKKFQKKYDATKKGKINCDKKRHKFRDNLKLKIIEYYSKGKNCCECCGEKQRLFLTVDHINNDGFKDKISGHYLYIWILKNNFPDGFQIYCMNCNLGKHLNHGVCPHKNRNSKPIR